MKRTLLIITIATLILATGCKSRQGTTGTQQDDSIAIVATREARLYNNMIESYRTWDSFTAKGKASIGYMSSSFELRMERDKAIQISLRPILGIEIARAIITQDSVYVTDKINKKNIAASIASLGKMLPATPTLSDIQNALLGRPFLLGIERLTPRHLKEVDIEIGNDNWLLQPLRQPHNINYLFNIQYNNVTSAQCVQVGTGRQLICHYTDFQATAMQNLPTHLDVTAKGQSNRYNLSIDYTNYTFDKETTINATQQSNYPNISLTDFIHSLLK